MAHKIENVNVLYLGIEDLHLHPSLMTLRPSDFKLEVQEQIKNSDVVVYSVSGCIPILIKSRY